MLKHHGTIAEFLNQAVFALDRCPLLKETQTECVLRLTSVGNLGNLVTVVPIPCIMSIYVYDRSHRRGIANQR